MPIIHAFDLYPKEGAIIGRLIAGFGKLEYDIAYSAAILLGKGDIALRHNTLAALFRLRQSSSRIGVADSFLAPACKQFGLEGEYGIIIGAVRKCVEIRNQYAHAHWVGDVKDGLFFADLTKAAEKPEFEEFWLHVDLPLLKKQEAYFEEADGGLQYLIDELPFRITGKDGRTRIFPKPKASQPPPLHNPTEEHRPQWITAEMQSRYEAHTQEGRLGDRSQKRKSKAPKLSVRQRRDRALARAKRKA